MSTDRVTDFQLELQSEFGEEAIFGRHYLSHLRCFGTQVCATITPSPSEQDTLEKGWRLVQDLAAWLLARAEEFPDGERFIVIVAWSKSVRPAQGHIFKAGGTALDLHRMITCLCFRDYELRSGCTALLPRWQKDVFPVV